MPLHSLSLPLVLIFLFSNYLPVYSVQFLGRRHQEQFPGLRPKEGDADYLPQGDYPAIGPTLLTCGRNTPLPSWPNAFPPPFNGNPSPYRSLESLCAFYGHRVQDPVYFRDRDYLVRTRSGNLGGICNTQRWPALSADGNIGDLFGDWASDVIFAESLAAPELYAQDALLVYCMRHCRCRISNKVPSLWLFNNRKDNDDDSDDERDGDDDGKDRRDWFRDGLRPGLSIDASNGGLVIYNSRENVERTLVEPAEPNSRLALTLSSLPAARSRQRTCRSGSCPVCQRGVCISPGDCAARPGDLPGVEQCACRASMRVDGERGKWTAWCGALLPGDSLLGKRDGVLESCACNATYISHGCCGSRDGVVWEERGAWLGALI